MRIILDEETSVMLRAWTLATTNEFSGLADVIRKEGNLHVSNAHVLDVGSWGYTEFSPEDQMKLARSENRRCWIHRHPITCWSGTDITTMTMTPCGVPPEMMQWAVSIVWTPNGWLGRLDAWPKGQNTHFDLPVVEDFSGDSLAVAAKGYMVFNGLKEKAEEMHDIFIRRHGDWYMLDENQPESLGETISSRGRWYQRLLPFLHRAKKVEKEDEHPEPAYLFPVFKWECPDCCKDNFEEQEDNPDEVRCEFCGGIFDTVNMAVGAYQDW